MNAPHLIIMTVKVDEDVAGLRRLSGAFIGWPIVALVDLGQDAEILLRSNRAGAAQVVPLPFSVDDFRDALKCVSLQFKPALRVSRVIAVTGAAHGCGATTLASNIVVESAVSYGRHTILVELARQMGSIATHLNLEPWPSGPRPWFTRRLHGSECPGEGC